MRHLRIYRAIRLIQRTGSIRKAAELLAVSPSALNRSVQAFEDEMTLPLFDRIPGGVRLTTAGELFLDLIDRHLTEFDDFRTQLASLREGLSGVLRLSLGSDIGAGVILAAVREFEDAFPGVSVEIATADSPAVLQRREADLALLTNPETDETTEVLHAQPVALVAWQGVGAVTVPAGLWDLVTQRLVLPPEGTGSRVAVSHLLRRNRLSAGAVSALPAAQVAQMLYSAPRIAIFPETVFDPATLPEGIGRLPLALGQVQLCILRAARVPMIRPAQAFLTVLQRRLDAAGRPPAPVPKQAQ
ncbi:LysR family transcriptional regulator [Roseicyclus mahoneyensis]|uniref:DNA-binding transcriptional LysR family regulator n=1 Tax=Roseicyclus mahoneyensis TaxID=164332 RepID=A0A316GDY8_9RHOB|nr:LysR family transcriptional regulator [Roseicyclus mahoneyensis]PWK59154.1 DNA-binding transcriptional LysR family regulator [Roseicyclus mahoneyensis]